MRGSPDEIERAVSVLAGSFSAELVASGWIVRDLDVYSVATLTRGTQNGVMATAEINRTSFGWPDDWPVEVAVRLGVGYEPALNLMPLLTLRAGIALVANPETIGWPGFTISLADNGQVAVASRQVAAFVAAHALGFAAQFPDAAAIDEALQRRRRADDPASAASR